jgi:dihydroorotase
MNVTAEVTPHHLLLTDHELLGYRTACKVNPPLREAEDVEATVAALADGTIDCIATDHAPHSPLEKDCELAAASPGLIGLETMLPLLLGLVRQNKLSLMRLIEATSTSAARVARLGGGTLAIGAAADIAVIDPDAEWTVARDTIASKSLNTPWLGAKMRGACVMTLVAGKVAYQR